MHEVGFSRDAVGPAMELRSQLPSLERFEVSGVPTFWVEAPPPVAAGLIFRVGRADETLASSGLSHLVEHLALFGTEDAFADMNGTVTATETHLYARGAESAVVAGLERVARDLAALPVDRLPAEKRVLEVEQQHFGGGIAGYLFSLRFGATGYGLVGWPEFGLSRIGAPELDRWARERFTRGNAALWVAGPAPVEFALELPDGPRLEPPAPGDPVVAPIPGHRAGGGILAASFLVTRSMAARAAVQIIGRRIRRRLRFEAGSSYSVNELYEPLTNSVAHAIVMADVLEAAAASATDDFVAALYARSEDAVTDEELEEFRRELDAALLDPINAPSLALSRATGELRGERYEWSPESLVEEAAALTGSDVTDALVEAVRSAIVVVPTGQTAAALPALEHRHRSSLTGRAYRPQVLMSHLRGTRLIVADEGVTFTDKDGNVSTVRFDACAALVRSTDGLRSLIGDDGQTISLSWFDYRKGTKLLRAIETRTPPQLVVDAESDDRAAAVEDAVATHLERRWVVFAEIPRLAAELDEDEAILTLAEATRSLRAGLLAVTDRRVLFLASGIKDGAVTVVVDVPRTQVQRVRGFQSVFGGRLTIRTEQTTYRFSEVEPRARIAEILATLSPVRPA
jgi:zinc protease